MEGSKCLAGVPYPPTVVNAPKSYPLFLLRSLQPIPASISPRPQVPAEKSEEVVSAPLIKWRYQEKGKTLIIWSEWEASAKAIPLKLPETQPVQLNPSLQSTTGIYSTGDVSQLAEELTHFLKLWAVETEDSFDIGQ